MKILAVATGITLLVAATWYVARFVSEYRKIRREIRRIRASGHAKSTIRAMRREAARGRNPKAKPPRGA